MSNYDQSQSPRLGQAQSPENPGVRIVTLAQLPEVAYKGQIVYLADAGYLYIYDGDAWQAVGDAAAGPGPSFARLFVSETDPALDSANAVVPGDQWYQPSSGLQKTYDNASTWQLPTIPDGAVTGSKLSADAINGKTVTGAVIKTNDAGVFVQIDAQNNPAPAAPGPGRIRFYKDAMLFGEISGSAAATGHGSDALTFVLHNGATLEPRITLSETKLEIVGIDRTLMTDLWPDRVVPKTLSFFGTVGTTPGSEVSFWKAASATFTTDANGIFTISYGDTVPNAKIFLTAHSRNQYFNLVSPGNTSTDVRATDSNNAVIANSSVFVTYMIMGV